MGSVPKACDAGRVFGVEEKGVVHGNEAIDAEACVRDIHVASLDERAGLAPYSVRILVFDMSDDPGYFGWCLAPEGSRSGARQVDQIHVPALDADGVRKVVREGWSGARARRPA